MNEQKYPEADAEFLRTGFTVNFTCPICGNEVEIDSTYFADEELWYGDLFAWCDECGTEEILLNPDRQVQ